MVELSEESLKEIHDSLNNIVGTVNEDIEEFEKSPENKQEEKEQIIEANIVDKEKSTVSSQEKKRFNQIGQIFVDTWIKSVQKLQAAQEKRMALRATKKESEPNWVKKLLSKIPRKKKEDPVKKVEKGWLGKLLKIVSFLSLVYGMYKDKIDALIPIVGKALAAIGGLLLKLCGQIISIVWDLVKQFFGSVYGWLVVALVAVLGPLGEAIMAVWDNFVGWISKAWAWIKDAFGGFIKNILALPSKILGWIADGIMWLLEPIINAIKAAWDWICDIFSGLFDWISGIFTNIWDTVTGIFDWYIGLYKKIWDIIVGLWDVIKDFFMGLWNGVVDFVKSFFSIDLIKKVGEAVAGLWDKFCNWIKAQARKTWIGRRLLGEEDDEDKENGSREEKKPEKKEPPKVEVEVDKKVEKQEIKMKDSILETIKELCERLNVFFSAKSGGFVDLSKAAIDAFVAGFKDVQKAMKKIELNNNYTVKASVDYDDEYSWDQADRSQRTINYDSRKQHYTNTKNLYQTIHNKKYDNTHHNDHRKKFNIENTNFNDYFERTFVKQVFDNKYDQFFHEDYRQKVYKQETHFNTNTNNIHEENRIKKIRDIKNKYDHWYDNRKTDYYNNVGYNYKNFDIAYNVIDIPSLDRAIASIEHKTDQEVEILRSQNDYLQKMIGNMDGMSKKLEWLNPENREEQPQNVMMPMPMGDNGPVSIATYNASVVKGVQASMARALAK